MILFMILAMFAEEHRYDWDDLLPAVMMAYRSSVHESTGFSPYRLMFGEECPLPMDVGLTSRMHDMPDPINNPYALWVREALEVAYDQVRARQSGDKNYFLINGCLLWGIGLCDTTPQLRSENWIHHGWGTLSGSFSGGVGGWCSNAPGFSSSTHSLSRPEKYSTTERPGFMAPHRQFNFVGYTSGPGH